MRILKANHLNVIHAAKVIRSGGIVIYPTDTVYGLGGLPSNPEATERICRVKGRTGKPLPLICSDHSEAEKIVIFSLEALRLSETFWPGQLMLVLPTKVCYPVWVTQNSKNLGVRVPDHVVARELAQRSGGVIVSTSANRSGEKPPRTVQEIVKQVGDEVDLVLDAGMSSVSEPSTVVDFTSGETRVLRAGPVTLEQINMVLMHSRSSLVE